MAGGERVQVLINVARPEELEGIDPAHVDGIGLVRTEFLFHAREQLPDEEEQYRVYRRIAEWAAGRPVTIRTLDAGGDKPIPGLTRSGESNPFLGVRGVRLSLRRPEVLKVQLRALARAAVHGNVKIMVPMIAVPDELAQCRLLLAQAVRELSASGVAGRAPAAWHDGRGARRGAVHGRLRRRLLLDREQRPAAVPDGGEPRRAGTGRTRRARPGLLAIAEADDGAWARRCSAR